MAARNKKHLVPPQRQSNKANVTNLSHYKRQKMITARKRVKEALESVVHVTGCGKVKLEELFCPYSPCAVVVIKRKDGSYRIPRAVYQSEDNHRKRIG